MSLETPIKIRMLQTKLYQKAKEEPNYHFYLLYDKMWRQDILLHAYELAKANKGAPGVDGQSFEHIESEGREEWLEGIPGWMVMSRGHPQFRLARHPSGASDNWSGECPDEQTRL